MGTPLPKIISEVPEGSSEVLSRYNIHYGPGRKLRLEGQIVAVREEGQDSANWLEIRVVYPADGSGRGVDEEISPTAFDGYEKIRRGGTDFDEVEQSLIGWSMGLFGSGLPISMSLPRTDAVYK